MSRTWTLSPIEFVAAWSERKESLPDPFFHALSHDTYEAAVRAKALAWQAARSQLGSEIESILSAISRPDIRLVVRAVDGSDVNKADAMIRMLAVRAGEVGYLVMQEPGETSRKAARFTITEHDALALGDIVAAALPEFDAGGKPDFTLVRADDRTDMDFSYGRSVVQDFEDEDRGRSSRFDSASAVRLGSIQVEQGFSRFGPRGITRTHLLWRDLAGDGRYVIVPGNPPTVTPADTRRLAGLINGRIAEVVRAIRDDRS